MNLANLLTAGRIIVVPLLVYLQQLDTGPPGLEGDWGKVWCLGLTLLAGVTDFLDGILARRWEIETKLGKFLDPVADKLLVTSLFAVLVAFGTVPVWMLLVVLWREFLVLGLRMHLASDGHVLGSSHWAKFKTIFQVSALVAVQMVMALKVLALSGSLTVPLVSMLYYQYIAQALLIVAMVLTVTSGVEYFVLHGESLR